jgi:hypothetical protein
MHHLQRLGIDFAQLGLAGMRERMKELNGKLEIESDGSGTTMRATVPLTAASQSEASINSERLAVLQMPVNSPEAPSVQGGLWW